MRLMIVCLAAGLAFATLPAPPVAARSYQETAAAPSPVRTELARQYLNLLMTDQFEGVVRQMLGTEFQNDSEIQALPEADRRIMLDLTAELTTEMVPQMIAEMVPVYAATFTEEELSALVAFYGSPLGRSIADKSIEVMPEADRAIMSVVPRMLEKLATRMCQHYGCSPEEQRQMLEGMREGAGIAPSSADRSK